MIAGLGARSFQQPTGFGLHPWVSGKVRFRKFGEVVYGGVGVRRQRRLARSR